MTDAVHRAPAAPKPNTVAAFLIAPGIASLVGALVVAGAALIGPAAPGLPERALSALAIGAFMAVAFALVGYATAAVVGVPVYLVLPERARSCFAVVVPLAGGVAAAPWLLGAAPWRNGAADMPIVAVPFALGIVAGIAFLFLRRGRAGAP